MIWIDGAKYEGGWALDEFDGYGTYYYNNGDVYKGEWKNGKKSGKGIFGIQEIHMKEIGLMENVREMELWQ